MNQSSTESNADVLDVGDLGRYRLIARLARGGMGDVYLAVQRGPSGFNKLAVLKELRDTLAEEPTYLEMFLDEARLAARLNHPNVVQTNEVGSDGARHYIAMEYLEGQPLQRIMSRLARTGELSLPMRLRILSDALAGLHYAHELCDFDGSSLHVVHRDVSPHNIIVTYDGAVKVLDFGIAKTLISEETRAGIVKGKAAYMAPEQAMGRSVDRRADIFSAGVMLWELVTNQRLWKGLTEVAVLIKVANESVPSPREVAPGAPEELVRICERALARDANDRYQTAAELRSDIERFIATLAAPVSNIEIGHLISETFADDRARLKLLVESSTRRVRSLPTGEYRAIDLARPGDEIGVTSPGSTAVRGQVASATFTSAISRARISQPPSLSQTQQGRVVVESLAPTSVDATGSQSMAVAAMPQRPSTPPLPAPFVLPERRTASVVVQGGIIGGSLGLVLVFVALVYPMLRAPRADGPVVASTGMLAPAAPSTQTAPAAIAPVAENLPSATPVLDDPRTPSAAPAPTDLQAFPASSPQATVAVNDLRRAPTPVAALAPARAFAPAHAGANAAAVASHAAPEAPPSPIEAPRPPAPAPEPKPAAPAPAAPPVASFTIDMMRPKLVSGHDPVYTREALLARVQGTMIAKCTITTSGALEDCRILKALPHMEQAFMESLKTRRYTPIIYQGRATAVEYVINVQLVLPS